MTNYFDFIPDKQSIEIGPGQKSGGIAFTITNSMDRSVKCVIDIRSGKGDTHSWWTMDTKPVQLDKNETVVRQVYCTVPENIPDGCYNFIPVVYDIDNPDEIYTSGAAVNINVKNDKKETAKKRIPSLILFLIIVALSGVIAGILFGAVKLSTIGNRYYFMKSFSGVVKNKIISDTVVVTADFWKNQREWELFLQKTYVKCDKPQISAMVQAIKATINNVERKMLLTGLGRIVDNNGQAVYAPGEIIRTVDRYFSNSRSNAAYNRPAISTCNRISGVTLGAANDGNLITAISESSICQKPLIKIDLCYERIVTRIDLYDSLGDETKKGFVNYSVKVLDDKGIDVWAEKQERKYSSHIQIFVPEVVGRYLLIEQKESDYLKFTEIEVYEKNIAFGGTSGKLGVLTDGDYSNGKYSRCDSSSQIAVSFDNKYIVKQLRIHFSGADTSWNPVVYHAERINSRAKDVRGTQINIRNIMDSITSHADSILLLEGKTSNAKIRFSVQGYRTTIDVAPGRSDATIEVPWIESGHVFLDVVSGIVCINEIEVYGVQKKQTDDSCITRDAKVHLSSLYADDSLWAGINAADSIFGDKVARTASKPGQWIELDLLNPKEIKNVSVYYDTKLLVKRNVISIFDDQGKCNTSDTICSNGFNDRYDIILKKHIKGRWVRVQSLDSALLSINEIRVKGKSSDKKGSTLLSAGKKISVSQFEIKKENTVNVNIAYKMPATMSSVFQANLAQYGVDGLKTGNFFHTSATIEKAWWKVDLGWENSIDSIVIYNRTDCCQDRFKNFRIAIQDKDSVEVRSLSAANMTQPSQTFKFPGGTKGRYCKISLNEPGILHLIEVEVYGRPVLMESSSRWYRGNPPEILIDGTGNEKCIVPDSNNSAWIEIDLLNRSKIDQIILYTGKSDKSIESKFITITCLDESRNKTGKVYRVPENGDRHNVNDHFNTCRYVRLEATDGDSLYISGVEVWGMIDNK